MRTTPTFRIALGCLLGAALSLTTDAAVRSQPVKNRVTLPSGRQVYVSGMNLAWISYSADVGSSPLDTSSFRIAIQDARDSGSNTMRVWLSTNGAHDPVYDANTGLVKGLGTQTIANVKSMLKICAENGVLLLPVLMSHNFTESTQNGVVYANNKKLLTTDAGIKAYVDNAVTPLVKAIGVDSALLAWEIFNEPEGMIEGIGWTAERITKNQMLTVVNRVAGAIHRAVPEVLVSNGAQTMATTTDIAADGSVNWYSDASLKAIGGDADGTLDFYMAHYYPWNGAKYSPFRKKSSAWNLDKPLVIGEFPAGSWSLANANMPKGYHPIYDEEKIDTLFSNLYNNGYAGGLSWCYFGDTYDSWLGDFNTSAPFLASLYRANTAAIKIKDVNRVKRTGNGILEIGYDNDTSSVWSALKKDSTMDFSGFKTISVKVLVPKSAKGAFKMHWVLKTKDAWEWDVSDTYCAPGADSTWSTCSADLAKIHYYADPATLADLKSVHSLILQIGTDNSFHGKIWLDSVKLDNTLLYSFDNGKPAFGADAYNANEAAKVTSLSVIYPFSVPTTIARTTAPVQHGQMALRRTGAGLAWELAQSQDQETVLAIHAIDGREVAAIKVPAGVTSGVLANLPKGAFYATFQGRSQVLLVP
ncbi:MAG: hypothetical protein RL318_2231 [Fibrobacterota bacterium]|jgi:hypothetical protein